MLVFVGCNYENVPFQGYRDVFRQVAKADQRVRFFFADARITNQSIMQKVREDIINCDCGLYDVTFRNPNVMMELGIAIGAGKRWNILYNPDRDRSVQKKGWFARPKPNELLIPANLRGYEYLEYTDKSQLEEKLTEWTRQTLTSDEQVAGHWVNSVGGVLSLLEAHPDLTMSEIAKRTGTETPMVRLTVTELRKKGLVRTNGKRGVATRYSIVAASDRPPPSPPHRPPVMPSSPSR
jgi:hypothetical protein